MCHLPGQTTACVLGGGGREGGRERERERVRERERERERECMYVCA